MGTGRCSRWLGSSSLSRMVRLRYLPKCESALRCENGWKLTMLTVSKAGVGYLNDWNLADKERPMPPASASSDTKYVNEAPAPES